MGYILENYFDQTVKDEAFLQNGEIVSHWSNLLDNIDKIGLTELADRTREIEWYLNENGVTYNVYNETGGLNRPWNLNPIPLVIEENEWLKTKKGLEQRALIFDLLFRDIYGKKELIKNKILPIELIYNHAGFLRACDSIKYSEQNTPTVYGCDLSRGIDDTFWVMGDKTQNPSGIGYTLENRLTISRVLPDLFENIEIKRLHSFFRNLIEMINNSSPKSKEDPYVVILTPGFHNETYFEHSYLATYLGFPLVQGNDLVARDDHLWLKTLKGLKQVDVVIRKVDDSFCDPLELREDSTLGIAGLLDVVRKGNITVINPIGSGVLENPGLIPFMERICKYFLNEDLILPQVATWWCGQKNELSYVLQNIRSLVIKRVDRIETKHHVYGNTLSEKKIEKLKTQILQRPYLYVGQSQLSFSTTPTFAKNRLEARNTLIRTYAISSKNGINVMPGGLVRVANNKSNLYVSNQSGGISKDLWILSSKKEDVKADLSKRGYFAFDGLNDIPSLTAENLFWMGRYTARILFTARYIRTLIKSISDEGYYEKESIEESKKRLCIALTHITMTYPGFLNEENENIFKEYHNEIKSVFLDKSRIGSLSHTIELLKNTGYRVKNLLSLDAWRIFDKTVKKLDSFDDFDANSQRKTLHALDQLITRVIALIALAKESILIDQGLLLFLIGLRLEKAMLVVNKARTLFTYKYEGQVEYAILEAMLNSGESLNIYRQGFNSHLRDDNVIDLLIFNKKYPQSLISIISALERDLSLLPKKAGYIISSEHEKFIFEAYAKLNLANFDELMIVDDESNTRVHLDELLFQIYDILCKCSNSISKSYFSHSYDQMVIKGGII